MTTRAGRMIVCGGPQVRPAAQGFGPGVVQAVVGRAVQRQSGRVRDVDAAPGRHRWPRAPWPAHADASPTTPAGSS